MVLNSHLPRVPVCQALGVGAGPEDTARLVPAGALALVEGKALHAVE